MWTSLLGEDDEEPLSYQQKWHESHKGRELEMAIIGLVQPKRTSLLWRARRIALWGSA